MKKIFTEANGGNKDRKDFGSGPSFPSFASVKFWLLLLLSAFSLQPCAFSEIIPADRRIDWAGNVGIPGGIPNRTVYLTMSAVDTNGVADSLPAIKSALAACPLGQRVLLPPGRIKIGGTLQVTNGISLGGSGMDTTTIVGPSSYGSLSVIANMHPIIFVGGPVGSSDFNNPTTGTLAQGATNLTLSVDNANLHVGFIISLSETNTETSLFDGANSPNQTYTAYSNTFHSQLVEVVGKAGASITFWPPVYYTFFGTNHPFVAFKTQGANPSANDNTLKYAGLEDFTLTNAYRDAASTCGNTAAVPMIFYERTSYCWLKNVKTSDADSSHSLIDRGFRNEVRGCYATNQTWYWTSGGYGMISYLTCATLWEDNICVNTRDFLRPSQSSSGCVVIYNYHTNRVSTQALATGIALNKNNLNNKNCTDPNPDNFTTSTGGSHASHPMMNLWEGNVTYHPRFDYTHGSGSHATLLRNWFRGPQYFEYANAGILNFQTKNQFNNIVGNVLGSPTSANAVEGGSWTLHEYSLNPTNFSNGSLSTYNVGYPGNEGTGSGSIATGLSIFTNYIVEGNWEYLVVTTQTWRYPSTTPDTITNSYYYASKPAYFGNLTWPPIDPTPITNAPIVVDTMIDFEGQAEGTVITPAVLTNVTKGNLFGGFRTLYAGCGGYDVNGCSLDITNSGAVPNMTITTNAAFPLYLSRTINGTNYTASGTNGMRVKMLDNNAIELSFSGTRYFDSLGFNLRFGGTPPAYQPQDLVTLRDRSAGTYQFLQSYDQKTGNPQTYAHAHFAPYGASTLGNDITLTRNHWYWITMNYVGGGTNMNVSFYDAENNYSLVGTSTGTVTGNATTGARTLEFGLVKYAIGTNSWWVDYDNVMISTNGTFPLGPPIPYQPTAGETNIPAGWRFRFGTNPPSAQLVMFTNSVVLNIASTLGGRYYAQNWFTNIGTAPITFNVGIHMEDGLFAELNHTNPSGFTYDMQYHVDGQAGPYWNSLGAFGFGPMTVPAGTTASFLMAYYGGTNLVNGLSAPDYKRVSVFFENNPLGRGYQCEAFVGGGHSSLADTPAAIVVAPQQASSKNDIVYTTNYFSASQTVGWIIPGYNGEAHLTFTLTNRSSVYFTADVQATNAVANSFGVDVDNYPLLPSSLWNLTATGSGFVNQTIDVMGVGVTAPDLPAKPWTLDAGDHTLIFVGMTADTKIANLTANITPIMSGSEAAGNVTFEGGGSLQ